MSEDEPDVRDDAPSELFGSGRRARRSRDGAARISGTRTDLRRSAGPVPPKQTTAWLAWIGEPVPGVEYKWAVDIEEYRERKHDAETWRAWLPSSERGRGARDRVTV